MLTMTVNLRGKKLRELETLMGKDREEILEQLVGVVDSLWAEKASAKLDTSLQRYLAARRIDITGKRSIKLSISGDKLAEWVEKGKVSGADMAPGFLKGRAYANIPLGPNGMFGFRRISKGTDTLYRGGKGGGSRYAVSLNKQYSYNNTGKNRSVSPQPYAGWGRSLTKSRNWYHPGIEGQHIIQDVALALENQQLYKNVFKFKNTWGSKKD
jgi:hypothetical protein